MSKAKNLLIAFLFLPVLSSAASAQGYAPELYGIGEIIVNYARFDDPKASAGCGLTREDVAAVLASSFEGTGVPAVGVLDAKPPVAGVARIQFLPEIVTQAGENLDCVSWISLSAESRAAVVIPPVDAPRSITAVYWRRHAKVFSSQTLHAQKVKEVLKNMAADFVQRYRIDQPSAPAQQ